MKRIAIIGSGITGMACAHELYRWRERCALTLYEKNAYIGGHTNTVTVDEAGTPIPIDTGFMVYNEATYPNLTRLFGELQVPTQPTSMSFSVQHCASGLEFAGTGMGGLFAQPSNLLRPRYWRLLTEIHRFNSTCTEVLDRTEYAASTLAQYLHTRGYSADFRDRYLIPMSAAVWSAPPQAMLEFPAKTLVQFFFNHRFLGLKGQLTWRTVVGGSQTYRDRLIAPFSQHLHVNRAARSVGHAGTSLSVTDITGQKEKYDAVVLACHADEALGLVEGPPASVAETLRAFRYQKNIATLHTDESLMPRTKRAWSSWNYRMGARGASTVYWMNRLQRISSRQNYFVSINDAESIHPSRVLKTIVYEHPLYTLDAMAAQRELPSLNERGRIFYGGSYFKHGFHEDALTAGLAAAAAVVRRIL